MRICLIPTLRLQACVAPDGDFFSRLLKELLTEKIKQKEGKATLYLEALSEFQPLVDQYAKGIELQGQGFPMPKLLQKYLDGLDLLVGEKDKGSYRKLVETYLKRGQRVVFIDSASAKDGTLEEREASFNQFAFDLIKKDQEQHPSDYDILTGAAHAQTQTDHPTIPGLSERLGILKNVYK